MRVARPVPEVLQGREFTRAEALAAGVSPERLRRRDIKRVGRGRYRVLDGIGAAEDRGGLAPPRQTGDPLGTDVEPATVDAAPAGAATGATVHSTIPRASQVLMAVPDACASHATAALLREWWLPDPVRRTTTVHVIRPAAKTNLTRPGVLTHRMDVQDGDVVRIHGRRVTGVERTWLDCARLLSMRELVVLGDSLVRVPHAWAEQRSEPWTTPALLTECVARYPGLAGISTARSALDLVRVGSDSPQETHLRLAMHAARLPEPTLQVKCWDPEYAAHFPATADLGYPEWKIAIQYEGEHHGGKGQLGRDLRRDQAFLRQGWTVLRFGSSDSREGFRMAVQLIAQAIRRAAPSA